MAKNQLVIACFFIMLLILFGCKKQSNQAEVVPMQRTSDLAFELNYHKQKIKNLEFFRIEEYPYITELQGGYWLDYYVDTSLDYWIQYLILMDQKRVVDTISGMSYGLKFRNLGFIAFDFQDEFMFSNSFGYWDACPSSLIVKETGESIFDGFLIDSCNNYLFFTHHDFLKKSDTIFCYNVNTAKKECCKVPTNVLESAEELGRSKIRYSSKMYYICNSNGVCKTLEKFEP